MISCNNFYWAKHCLRMSMETLYKVMFPPVPIITTFTSTNQCLWINPSYSIIFFRGEGRGSSREYRWNTAHLNNVKQQSVILQNVYYNRPPWHIILDIRKGVSVIKKLLFVNMWLYYIINKWIHLNICLRRCSIPMSTSAQIQHISNIQSI